MGECHILEYTTKTPLQMIGEMAGICWGSDIEDQKKNYKRAIDCIESGHGRVIEFPDVYMELSGYSAKVIRELYTHIGGSPTRLQASTRYINYTNFKYITPNSISNNKEALSIYKETMANISSSIDKLMQMGIEKEDANMLLPVGMSTKIVYKVNARTLMDMSRQRMCARAYWEFRKLFNDIILQLSRYSSEWKEFCNLCFKPKCDVLGYCPEKNRKGDCKYPVKK